MKYKRLPTFSILSKDIVIIGILEIQNYKGIIFLQEHVKGLHRIHRIHSSHRKNISLINVMSCTENQWSYILG